MSGFDRISAPYQRQQTLNELLMPKASLEITSARSNSRRRSKWGTRRDTAADTRVSKSISSEKRSTRSDSEDSITAVVFESQEQARSESEDPVPSYTQSKRVKRRIFNSDDESMKGSTIDGSDQEHLYGVGIRGKKRIHLISDSESESRAKRVKRLVKGSRPVPDEGSDDDELDETREFSGLMF